MALLDTTRLTLLDHSKRKDPQGKIPTIAMLLEQTNEILTDSVFMEGNLETGHRVVIQTGLPAVYYRALNQGIPNSKAQTAQVDESCSILEARSEIDKDLAMLNGMTAEFRLSEARMFLESMNQRMATTLFYGNPASDPKEFLGIMPRYSVPGAGNGQNILNAGGAAGNLTSIVLVVWGEETVFCPYPKGSTAGLQRRDLGEQTIFDAGGAGLRMQALVEWFQWKNGLVVKDWRYIVRICNISISDLLGQTGTQALTAATHIIKLMARATYRPPTLSMGRAAFYMNRTVHSGLAIAAMDKSQNVLKINEGLSQFGTARSYLSFLGIPIRQCDAIVNTEGVVTGF